MARKSKFALPESKQEVRWRAALYIRLSREDGDKDESDSIVNQRELLYSFAEDNPELEVVNHFEDDGYTGTSFDRPAFSRMMEMIRNKKINCVVVKDLSRLGRNYIEAGKYIEQIFPFMDVRFISVNDMLDSFKNPSQMNTVLVPFKNLINDEYCRDISNKVRSSLDLKRRQGYFIGSFASYGYGKDPKNKGRLVVDDCAADVVRDIYKWFTEGKSIIGIAKTLNSLGIPNPSAYKRSQGFKYKHPHIESNDKYWPDSSVRRILTNRLYTGDLVQGKNRTKSYKVRQSVSMPEDEWIIVPDTHEAIIDRDLFESVQSLLARDTRVSPNMREAYLLSGFVRCADCGRAMNRKHIRHSYADYSYYVCSTYKKVSAQACSKHTIRADRVEELVLAAVKKQIELAVSMEELIGVIESGKKADRKSSALLKAVSDHTLELERTNKYIKSIYEDWKNGDLTREEYLSFKKEYEERIKHISKMIGSLQDEQLRLSENGMSDNKYLESFKKYGNVEQLSRDLVAGLIDMIYVHEGGNITIRFKFEDEFAMAVEFIETNKETLDSRAGKKFA